MNIRVFWMCATGVVILALLSGNASCSLRKPTELDLKTPLDKINAKWQIVLKTFNLKKFIAAIIEILIGCFSIENSSAIHFYSSNQTITRKSLLELQAYINTMSIELGKPLVGQNDFKEYCKGEDFETIHNYLWKDKETEDNQLKDVIHFFYRFGYRNIYTTIINIYTENECKGLIDLPTGPPEAIIALKKMVKTPSNIRAQLLESGKQPRQLQEQCNLIQILAKLKEQGVFDLLGFFQTFAQEFATKPSLHFMVGKIQEPIKKSSFRNFRLLEPIRKLFAIAHENIIKDPVYLSILSIIRDILGIDLINNNIIETVVSFVELILWQNVVPVPPYTTTGKRIFSLNSTLN